MHYFNFMSLQIAPVKATRLIQMGFSIDSANLRSAGADDQGNNETVQTKSLSENEDEDHSDEEGRLLGGSAHSSISHNSDGHAGGKSAETHAESSTKMGEALEVRVVLVIDVGSDDHRDNETVDTDHTRHDDRRHRHRSWRFRRQLQG